MLSSVRSKLSSLLDARFAISYLAPAAIATVLAVVLTIVERGVRQVMAAWQGLKASTTVSGGLAAVIVLVVLAYLLQAVTTPLLQFWEGRYLPGWLTRRWRAAEAKRAARIAGEMERLDLKAPHPPRYFGFPRDPQRLRPTRLGNALAAAEEYPLEVYGLDGVLWWPRLLVVLPDSFHRQIDDAMAPLVGLLNLGMVLVIGAFVASIALLFDGISWMPFWLPALVGLPAAWLCYRAAVGYAVGLGSLIRVAFDFHRLDILRKMSIRVPESYEVERTLWKNLNAWVHTFVPPGSATGPSDPEWMRPPFEYAPTRGYDE